MHQLNRYVTSGFIRRQRVTCKRLWYSKKTSRAFKEDLWVYAPNKKASPKFMSERNSTWNYNVPENQRLLRGQTVNTSMSSVAWTFSSISHSLYKVNFISGVFVIAFGIEREQLKLELKCQHREQYFSNGNARHCRHYNGFTLCALDRLLFLRSAGKPMSFTTKTEVHYSVNYFIPFALTYTIFCWFSLPMVSVLYGIVSEVHL